MRRGRKTRQTPKSGRTRPARQSSFAAYAWGRRRGIESAKNAGSASNDSASAPAHCVTVVVDATGRRRTGSRQCGGGGGGDGAQACGLLPQHVHCHRLITHCSHFLLNFQLPTGFVLVG